MSSSIVIQVIPLCDTADPNVDLASIFIVRLKG